MEEDSVRRIEAASRQLSVVRGVLPSCAATCVSRRLAFVYGSGVEVEGVRLGVRVIVGVAMLTGTISVRPTNRTSVTVMSWRRAMASAVLLNLEAMV